jgi:hypothetical protein
MADPAILTLVETRFMPGTVALLYTVETGVINAQVRLTSIALANQDAVARPVTMYKVPKGGGPLPSNVIVPGSAVPANTLMVINCMSGIVLLGEGQMLYGFASGVNMVTVTVSGEKYS